MKINLFWCIALVLGFAAIAASQEVDHFYVTESARHYDPYVRSHFGAPASPDDCETDCQVDWGQYRNGSLWENYCLEKQMRREHLIGSDRQCLDDSCRPSPMLFAPRPAACERSGRSRHSKCQHERLLSFDLFCELLGWRDCDCCVGSRCDGSSCTSAAPLQPHHPRANEVGPVVKEPGPAHHGPAQHGPAQHGPAQHGPAQHHRAAPAPDRPRAAADDAGNSAHSADHQASPINPPATTLIAPTPEQLVPEPPTPSVLQQDAPEVPRNKLPKADPASTRSTRRPTRKVLVAERLSDYIKI